VHSLWKSNMERIDFIESRTELEVVGSGSSKDWATT